MTFKIFQIIKKNCKILKEPFENGLSFLQCSKWQNFAKSGHTVVLSNCH